MLPSGSLDGVSVGPKGTLTAALFISFHISLEVGSSSSISHFGPQLLGQRQNLCRAGSGNQSKVGQFDRWEGRRKESSQVACPVLPLQLHRIGNGPTAPGYSSCGVEGQALPGEWQMLSRMREVWGVTWF